MKNKFKRIVILVLVSGIISMIFAPATLAQGDISPGDITTEAQSPPTDSQQNTENTEFAEQQPATAITKETAPTDLLNGITIEEENTDAQPNTTAMQGAFTFEELLIIAQSDGARVAEILNAYTDDTLFEEQVCEILKYYYESQNPQLERFSQTIADRATPKITAFAQAEAQRQEEDLPFVSGEVLVVFNDDATQTQIEQVIEEQEAQSAEVAQVLEEKIAVVEIALDQTVEQATEEYTNDPIVKFAQPNYIYTLAEEPAEESPKQIMATPNDSAVALMWHLNSIKTFEAWDYIATLPTANKIKVAVLDSGLEINHPDIQANINKSLCVDVTTKTAPPYPQLTRDATGVTNGHGSHVTGIIGATANNSVGGLGVASGYTNNILELFTVDVFTADTNSASTASIVRGIEHALANGARVINLSLGSSFSGFVSDYLMESALTKAVTNGTVVVAAAGNDSLKDAFTYPADYDQCISVIALDQGGTVRASYSNWGEKKDISAPGSKIYSIALSDSYAYKNGTSMASPVVSAVVAMVLYVNPRLSVDEVKDVLYTTATDIYDEGKDSDSGYGRVNAYDAVVEAKKRASGESRTLSLNSKTLSLNKGATQKLTATASPTLKPSDITWTSSNPAAVAAEKTAGSLCEVTLSAKSVGTSVITAYSFGYPTASCTVTVKENVVKTTTLSSSNISLNVGENRGISAILSPNIDDGSVTWSTSDPNIARVSKTSSGNVHNATIVGVSGGSTKITVTASGYPTATCTVTVAPNKLLPPTSLYLTNNGDKNIYLSWSAVSGANGYKIYKSTDGANYYELASTAYTNYADTEGKKGNNYYRITATHQNGSLNSDFSAVAQLYLNYSDGGNNSGNINKDSYSDTIEGFVDRSYNIVLGREGDTQGKKAWTDNLKSGNAQGAKVALGFVFSDEYLGKNTSNADFVEMLFKYLLNRPSDPSGKSSWVNCLDAGMSRYFVFSGFINSPEFTNYCARIGIVRGDYASTEPRDQSYKVTEFVSRLYKICLNRTPDADGLNQWTTALLQKTATGSQIAYGIFFSPEFLGANTSNDEYVDKLYLAMMGRGADGTGKSAWVSSLNGGNSRLNVYRGFVYSTEFDLLCTNYGILRGDI